MGSLQWLKICKNNTKTPSKTAQGRRRTMAKCCFQGNKKEKNEVGHPCQELSEELGF